MLGSLDKMRLMRVSRGFYACVQRQLEWHKIVPKKELEGYWYFLKQFYKSTVLLENFLLERFRELYKKGLQKNIAHYTVSEEILSVLVFYLCSRNKRLLGKLMHTVVPSLDAVTRRSFRRLVLRTQLYLLQKEGTINRKTKQQIKMSKKRATSVSREIKLPLPDNSRHVSELTTHNLQLHNKRKAASRAVRSPKRYKPEPTTFKDDLSVSEVGSEEVPIEERSVDSQSVGSLKDFIVDDVDSTASKSSQQEQELSDRETEDSQSFHSSALTDSESLQNE